MKRNFYLVASRVAGASLAVSFFLAPPLARSASITGIDFKTENNRSQIEIRSDGPVTYEKQENAEDKQLVLELQGARLSKPVSRKMPTTSFDSVVSLISPYQVEGQPDTARVVIQLKDMASADIQQEGNLIRVSLPNSGGTSVAEAASAEEDTEPAPAGHEANADENKPAARAAQPVVQPKDDDTAKVSREIVADSRKPKTNLDVYMENSQSKRFTGKPVTLQVRNADLTDVLRLIGEASGFNILVGEGVGGTITLSLVDVPWDQALDVILSSKKLGAERKNNILRIATLDSLTSEKDAILKAKEATDRAAPRITRIFPISYADPSALMAIIGTFGKASAASATTTAVQLDSRTNSLVIQDIADNIERIRKLIELLDTPTPQVLIEAKIIEASENFGRTIGGSLGLSTVQSDRNALFASFAGGKNTDSLLATDVTSTSRNGTLGFTPNLSFLPGNNLLNAVLGLGEEEHHVKVIASPKLVVSNKKAATILQGTPVRVPTLTTVAGVGTVPGTSVAQANLSLGVTPTVTNAGSVSMLLNISRDVPQADAVAPRNINTEVLVDNGSTLVIGGIYTNQVNEDESGFPFLRKIPILGWFFGTESSQTTRVEIFIFITPRIINEREMGLTS